LLYNAGFRTPIVANIKGVPGFKGDENIEPETIDTYELVLMHQRPTWKTEAVVFYSKWRDAIITVPSDDPDFQAEFVNAGENTSRGVELSYQWHPRYWIVDTNGSYVESKDETHGFDYTAFPKIIINIGLGYEFAPYNTSVFMANRVHADASSGPRTSDIDPQPLKDYWRTDVNVTHQRNGWEWFFNIKNLFDRNNVLPSVSNSEGGIPGEPFSFSVGARVKI
jgi:iron complex outermembrane receptor protein